MLDTESFQRLLAAAYILQSRSERPVTISTADKTAFATTAIVQIRTPFIQPSLARPSAIREANNTFTFTGLMMFWRRIDALAIAVVLFLMMGMSIHHRSAYHGRSSPPSGKLEARAISWPATSPPKILASQVSASSQQPAATRKSRQSHDEEVDVFSEEVVVPYFAPTVKLPGQTGKGITSSTELSRPSDKTGAISKSGAGIAVGHEEKVLASSVVRYGGDVTMWSSGQPSLGQSRKSSFNHEKQ